MGPCGMIPTVDDRCELWSSSYAHSSNLAGGVGDRPRDVVPDPLGQLVFVVGLSDDGPSDYVTLAYRADTGALVWERRWDGGGTDDRPWAAEVSSDGSRLFVTGSTDFVDGSGNQATIVYDARTGGLLWARTVERPEDDWGIDVVVSPDDAILYATAISELPGDSDVGVTAYRASTGEELWSGRFGTGRTDSVVATALSPDGRTLVAASVGAEEAGVGADYVLTAVDTGTRALRWNARWNVGFLDFAYDLEMSPAGDRVFVTGFVEGVTPPTSIATDLDIGTAAYDTQTGQQMWVSRYHSDHGGPNAGFDVAVSPDGSSLFATGQITGLGTYMDLDFGTVAIDAATGQRRWTARYQVPGQMFEFASGIDVSPNGSKVYVTGWGSLDAFTGSVWHGDSVTLAYDTATGAQSWAARYSNGPPFTTYGLQLAVDPQGRVFTAGTLFYFATTTANPADISVLAYNA